MKNKIDKKEIALLLDLYNSQKFGECEIEIIKLFEDNKAMQTKGVLAGGYRPTEKRQQIFQ